MGALLLTPARLCLGLTFLCVSCGDEVPPWVGTYDASSSWDLSGPLAGGRTVGDAVADLLIDTLIGLSGVPSALEDQAHEQLSALIRADVKEAVDAVAPAELSPDGTLSEVLRTTLASVRVESSITLEEGLLPASFEGVETIHAIHFEHAGALHEILPLDLLAAAGATIKGD